MNRCEKYQNFTGRNARMIYDDEFFAIAWRSKIPVIQIAEIYGTSRAAIYRAANRFNMLKKNAPPVVPVIPIPKPKGLEDQLLWSKGRWSLLAQIAEDHGITMLKVQAAYHRVQSAQYWASRLEADGE